MKKILFSALALFSVALTSFAQEAITIKGPNGLLSAVYHKPVNFIEGQKCPMVILMHGFRSSKEDANLRQIATSLEQQGVATLLFDFSAHGQTAAIPENKGFKFKDLTLKKELKDAAAIIDYAKKLPFVKGIGIVGHSLGGVVGLFSAADYGKGTIKALMLMAPAASLREDALRGNMLGKTFDPNDPPRSIEFSETESLGRDFIEEIQKTNILKTAASYKGDCLILFGKNDQIIPYSYGEYLEQVMPNAKYEQLKGLDHNFGSEDIDKHNKAMEQIVNFMVKKLK